MSLVLDYPLSVKYNGTDLHSVNGVSVLDRVVNDLPNRSVRLYKLARQDGSIVTTSEYADKKIKIIGAVILPSRTEAEEALDAIRAIVAEPEGQIDVTVAGTTRRWTGTMSGMSNTLKGGYATFAIEFTCADPFGTDTDTVTLINGTSNTASNNTFSMAIEGSYKAEPYITINYSAISGGTGATVSLYNAADGIGLDITRDWTTGDILEVDNLNQTVQVNSTDVTRVGRFFSFQPGARGIGYNDTFSTSRTMTITATYQKRYV